MIVFVIKTLTAFFGNFKTFDDFLNKEVFTTSFRIEAFIYVE